VFVPVSAIDPSTGGIAPQASRLDPAWSTIREIGSSGRSTTEQASFGIFYPYRRRGVSPRLRAQAYYTITRIRDEAGTLPVFTGAAPIGLDPLGTVRGRGDRERPHDLQLWITYQPKRWATVNLLGRLTSGLPFTPRVDGDVNGDGVLNDPAFVFDPRSTPDTSLAAGMQRLLADLPDGTRRCLEHALGSLAGRNSCRAGWTSSLDLRAQVTPFPAGSARLLQLAVSTRNALVLVDSLVHGRDGVSSWGEASSVDPVLLRVTGFDPARERFLYEVNPRFGRALRRGLASFALTIEARVTVGQDPAYQPLQRLVNHDMGLGRSPEELRLVLAERIPNLPAQVLAVDSSLQLALSVEQRTTLVERAEILGARLAPIADTLATLVSTIETGQQRGTRSTWSRVRTLETRIQAALQEELPRIREILTPQQWSRLPDAILVLRSSNFIPPRALRGQRGGS
jgi:hypothetical protein